MFRGYESGAVDVLFKPINTEILRQKADGVLRAASPARSSSRQAVQAREDVLAIVSHDMRTPLAVVHTTTSMLLNPKYKLTPEQVREQHERIRRNVELMNRMIGDLMDMVNLRSRPAVHQPEAHGRQRRAARSRDRARSAGARQGAAHFLRRRHGRDARRRGSRPPHAAVPEPARQRGQVLQGRRQHHGDQPHARQPARRSRSRTAGPASRADDLPHIFDPYYSASKKHQKTGTGLGLYIAKGIVDAHGGQIRCKSEPGVGTTFNDHPAARLLTFTPWPARRYSSRQAHEQPSICQARGRAPCHTDRAVRGPDLGGRTALRRTGDQSGPGRRPGASGWEDAAALGQRCHDSAFRRWHELVACGHDGRGRTWHAWHRMPMAACSLPWARAAWCCVPRTVGGHGRRRATATTRISRTASFHAPSGAWIAAGARGRILRSSDGGKHWTALPSPLATDLQTSFVDPKTQWLLIGGDQGVIGMSNDGGASWHVTKIAMPEPVTPVTSFHRFGELLLATSALGRFLASKDEAPAGTSCRPIARPSSRMRPSTPRTAPRARGPQRRRVALRRWRRELGHAVELDGRSNFLAALHFDDVQRHTAGGGQKRRPRALRATAARAGRGRRATCGEG